METPQEIQRRLWSNPKKFAADMEAKGKREVKKPEMELVGRLHVDAVRRLKDHLAQPKI